jgi:flagellar hook-associated protein 2
VTTSESASIGSHSLKINSIAYAEKLSSKSFTGTSEALGASYAGDILINQAVISIAATDTLSDVMNKINSANSGTDPTGVTAGIVNYGPGDYRLILTSDSTGKAGIGLLNGGATDILNQFGFIDTSRVAKNQLAGADRSDRFTSTNVSIQSLLGLTTAQTSAAGDIKINGQNIGAIDLSTDTLTTLQSKFANATPDGLTASITTETEDGKTFYRLMIEGSANTYTDKSNILETLGFIEGGVSDVYGVTGDIANTSGGAAITAATLIKDIDGYTGYVSGDYIHLEGTDTDGNPVPTGSTLVLSDTTTVDDLLTKIESLFGANPGDVTATVTGTGKLMVVDNTPGTSPLSVKINVKNSDNSPDPTLLFDTDGDLGTAASVRQRQITAGADASVVIDGVSVTSETNTIDDVLTGVTLDLIKADPATTVTLNIARDLDAIIAKINAFVESYNSIASYIHTQTSYDTTEEKVGGILFGDGTLASVKSDLTSTLLQSVWGVSSEFSTLGLVGINVDTEGQLSVDETKLRGYLTTNFNDIQKLFVANGEASVGTLSYISHSNNTKAGEYTVDITTVATKSVSEASDNTSLSGDEELTIVEGEKTAVVSLTSGMTMSQIVDAINSELDTVYTQSLVGSKQLYSGSGGTTPITAATTWNSVYVSATTSAGLINNDVISFSGTTRSGGAVSGSYTILDTATDTVQGLLSAIETAFNNEVTAAINGSGQIMLTDKTSGASNLSLTIDEPLTSTLDFGTVSTTNPGGQEGRYAIPVTASADATDHLVLTHDAYGSAYIFTVTQANNRLWTDGAVTINLGSDVAGTINGEAATGSGQVLTGNSGDANVDGLVVKYTGSATGSIGTVKLTLGVAELFDRALFAMTDSFDGYIAFKQESLQDSITSYTTQIGEMEARLERKREQLLNSFIKMELALQQIQSQSSWLAGQLTAASSGWGSI